MFMLLHISLIDQDFYSLNNCNVPLRVVTSNSFFPLFNKQQAARQRGRCHLLAQFIFIEKLHYIIFNSYRLESQIRAMIDKDGFDVIHRYSRKQAIEDGVLIVVTEWERATADEWRHEVFMALFCRTFGDCADQFLLSTNPFLERFRLIRWRGSTAYLSQSFAVLFILRYTITQNKFMGEVQKVTNKRKLSVH